MLMGFPIIPFLLCDFWAVFEETLADGVLRVRGALSDGEVVIAQFRHQSGPKGAWKAFSLASENEGAA